jgi:hypothetical protein
MKRPIAIPRHRWENIIKMEVRELGCPIASLY